MSTERVMRVGLCGLGEIGQHHLEAIRGAEGAELVAVCDLDQELARRSAGAATPYTDLDLMLDEAALDVLDICLPHSLHRDVALRALEAGCHVLLEKPMAVGVAACDEIATMAAERGLLVGVSHNQLHYAPHRRLAELIEDGRLGELRSLYARLWIGGRYGGWREDSAAVGGGLLMDAGVHRIYCLRALGGPVRSLLATMDRPRAEESFTVTLEFESGAVGVAQGSYHGPEGTFDDRLDAVGSEGAASVAGCEAYFEGDLGAEVPRLRTRLNGAWREEPVSGSWRESVRQSVQQILASLARGEEPTAGATAGRETVALIDAAYRSAEAGERVLTRELDTTEAS